MRERWVVMRAVNSAALIDANAPAAGSAVAAVAAAAAATMSTSEEDTCTLTSLITSADAGPAQQHTRCWLLFFNAESPA
jgi:hypothetical protein